MQVPGPTPEALIEQTWWGQTRCMSTCVRDADAVGQDHTPSSRCKAFNTGATLSGSTCFPLYKHFYCFYYFYDTFLNYKVCWRKDPKSSSPRSLFIQGPTCGPTVWICRRACSAPAAFPGTCGDFLSNFTSRTPGELHAIHYFNTTLGMKKA